MQLVHSQAAAPQQTAKPSPLLRLPKVKTLTCQGKTAIYAGMKNGTFPRSVRIGARSVAWRESEVLAWIESRPSTPTVAPLES